MPDFTIKAVRHNGEREILGADTVCVGEPQQGREGPYQTVQIDEDVTLTISSADAALGMRFNFASIYIVNKDGRAIDAVHYDRIDTSRTGGVA